MFSWTKLKMRIFGQRRYMTMKGKIFLIVGLYAMVGFMLFGLSYIQSNTMDSVRSYVRGEGLWSKAQKDAVFHLLTFSQSGDPAHYDKFKQVLLVPLGDRKARELMQTGNFDYEEVYQQFIIAQNHVDDVDGMITFFTRFKHFPYMSDAIVVWTDADNAMQELIQLGSDVYQAKIKNEVATLTRLLKKLDALNWKLAELELKFSSVLSEGARWVKRTLMQVSIALLVIMLIAVLYITRRIVSGIEKTENELLISENRFLSLYQSNMLGILDWHSDGRIEDANFAFLDMLGFRRDDVDNGKLNWNELSPESDRVVDEYALKEIANKGMCTPFEKELIHKSGKRVPVFLGAALLGGEDDKGICFIVDLSERKRVETQMRLAATVFDTTSEGIIVTDKNLKIVIVNRAFSVITGYKAEDVKGYVPHCFQLDMGDEISQVTIARSLETKDSWSGDLDDTKKDGTIFPVHLSINAVRDNNNDISHYVAIYIDITERKSAEEQLRKMAHYDYLTGLSTRSMYNERLEHALQRAKRFNSKLAVMFIDLDKFKPVNDRHGHEAGDAVLQEVARRLGANLRDNDIVARIGGDEFVVVLEDLEDVHDAIGIAEEIILSLLKEFKFDDISLQLGCSIGISLFPADSQDVVGLTRCSDIAMYAAKAAGGNRYFCFNTCQGNNIPEIREMNRFDNE